MLDRAQPPDHQRIVIGQKALRRQALLLHPLTDQQSQRLVRVSSGKCIDNGMMTIADREAFDQQSVGSR